MTNGKFDVVDGAKLETSIPVIASLAEPHWADNWNFRAYLQQEVDPGDIDRKVHEINTRVSAAIDCTKCGNCCREIHPNMTSQDLSQLTAGLGLKESDLDSKIRVEADGTAVFCESPCPMLKENKCTVYQHRPDDCREYPHLHKPDFLGGSVGVIENYGTCPIIFNVYRELKKSFSYNPENDYIGETNQEE